MAGSRDKNNQDLHTVDIACVPPQVDIADLHNNGLLISEQNKQAWLDVISPARYPKKDEKTNQTIRPFAHLVLEGKHYAIYHGRMRKKALGSGSFGVVKLAQDIETGKWMALKVTKVIKGKVKVKNVEDESELLKQATGVGGYITNMNSDKPLKCYAIMQLAEGMDGQKLLKHRKKMSPHEILRIAQGFFESIEKLHAAGILHRDIKPANFTCNPITRDTKVIDFGFACKVDLQTNIYKDKYAVGTEYFMAPETYAGVYSTKSDGFALGVALAEWLGFKEVARVRDGKEILVLTDYLFEELIPDTNVRDQLLQLVKDLTKYDPKERLEPKEGLKRLNEIFNTMGYSRQRNYAVGAFDVEEYKKLDNQQKKAFIGCLSQFDQVVMVEKAGSQMTPLERAILHRELTDAGVACIAQCEQYSNKENLVSNLQEKLKGTCSHVCYVTQLTLTHGIKKEDADKVVTVDKSKSKRDYQKAIDASYISVLVTPEDRFKIIRQLQKENDRIQHKHTSNPEKQVRNAERVKKIQKVILEIGGDKNLDYGKLQAKLANLEKELHATNKNKFTPALFQTKRRDEKLAENISRDITVNSSRRSRY